MVSRTSVLLILYCIQGSLGHAVPQSPTVGIGGGVAILISTAPYMASVHVGGSFCGGSIISRRFILTAGHCVKKQPRSSDYVRVGSDNRNEGGKTYSIEKYITHYEYYEANPNKRNYDLGLLKLTRSLRYSSGTVAKIELSWNSINPGELAWIFGWGRTEDETRTYELHEIFVTITSLSTCMNYYNNYRLTDKNICASDNGRGACKGDSGGPLVYDGRQIGIYSAGGNSDNCGYNPGIYVNVAAHMEWIILNMLPSCPIHEK